MANPVDFKRRLRFIGQRLRDSGADFIEETNREFRALAVKTLKRHQELTPTQKPRPDRAPSPTPLKEGWRLKEEGDIRSESYTVSVVNVHDRTLTNKDGKVYRKANGQFFTVLDALDVGTRRHYITAEGPFYFWWDHPPGEAARYFTDTPATAGLTVIDHPGARATGVLRIPRAEAAREARNIRRRAQRRAARAGRAR